MDLSAPYATTVPTGQVFLTSLNSTLLGTDELSSEGGVSSFLPLTGYHIESGFFTTPGTRQIVTSAPRNENHFGSVEILTIGVTLVTVTSIIGKEADGYFGYDFAVVNFDPESGELDSLVIGCPFCNRERGRVYVYTHTGNTANPFTEESVIEALSSSRGRFGLVVENIRDIDLDGIDDIAFSAPFEGEGVVYV
ncbi:integrin alpha-4-like [Halichondria panicea]|uniref:integrin alpha-4-like n=1 Tax=Halichondria panicea TaxID=6063 RepID=UPI00312B540A